MAGEEKFGYFHLGEGTEGEDGSLSSGCGWLEVLCVWSCELVTDCSSFVGEKSGKVVSCYRSGGRWWRGTEERIKCSEEITHVWSAVDLVVEVWGFGSVDFSRERQKQRLIPSQVRRIVWFAPFSLCRSEFGRCSRRTSDNQGLEGAARAGLEERGQMSSRQEVKVEHKVSVAAFTPRDVKWVGEGREEDTTEERRGGKGA